MNELPNQTFSGSPSAGDVHPFLRAILAAELAPIIWEPRLLGVESAWWQHVPFAFWLTASASPSTIVELGTHNGVSYAAFCEAVLRTGLSTRCYAVDTWAGDVHAGQYDDRVYNKIRDFNDKNYSGFSELIRSTFDEAVAHFSNGSIDILHIDGLHTYEAVRNDFETWLPKLSDRAIVLFHDTNVKQGDFGVWRYWSEVSDRYPSFEFLHGHGLGVLAVGPKAPSAVLALCSIAETHNIATVREWFRFAGRRWFTEWRKTAEGEWLSSLHRTEAERALQVQNSLDIAARELAAAQTLIAQVRSSTSWRLTMPMRVAGRAAKRAIAVASDIRAGRPVSRAPAQATNKRRVETPPAPLSPKRVLVTSAGLPKTATLSEAALSAHREAPIPDDRGILKDPAKLLAFYLPQYHRIPENSRWWGPGFTEWTNVARAAPNFKEHYQPHVPGQLGFYDLSHVETMREQADLAKSYGIHGFCIYYYWFSGRKILELPLNNFLASDIDFPFCLCWANENWTRTWDGDNRDILLGQGYADGDEERFIESLLPFFHDRRYIRVDGAPMLLLYRAMDIPDPRATIAKWREIAERRGIPRLHVVVVDFYDISDPGSVGADAMVEFPPHKFNGAENCPEPFPKVTNSDFTGSLVEYSKVVLQAAAKPQPEFTYYRGIMPGWDNTARRQNTPTTVVNSSPPLYEIWLRYLRTYNRLRQAPADDNFIFVNAWNEWGEGCHLEPDLRFGLQFLEATSRTSWYDAQEAPRSLEGARALVQDEVRDWRSDASKRTQGTSSGPLVARLIRSVPPLHRAARHMRRALRNALGHQ